jgi:chaperone BCS1
MDECYYAFIKLFQTNKVVHTARSIRFTNGKYGSQNSIDKSIGTGTHYLFYKGVPIKVSYEIEKTLYNDEKIHLNIVKFGRSHKLFDELKSELQNIVKHENETDDRLIAYSYDSHDNYWRIETRIRKRHFNTIFIDDKIKNGLINHLDNFYSKEEWYHERGIPYQTGICLYGPAGTGKTSIVKGLASHYNKSLCILRSSEINELPKALKKLPSDCFIVIEDIDTSSIVMERNPEESLEDSLYKIGRKVKSGHGSPDEPSFEIDSSAEEADTGLDSPAPPVPSVNEYVEKAAALRQKSVKPIDSLTSYTKVLLSDVLNAMDGLISIDKRVIIFTTNHLEKLDRALIRPGRIDCLEMIDYISYEQFLRFCRLFYKDTVTSERIDELSSIYSSLSPKTTVAELQKDFMQGMKIEDMMETYCLK